MSKDLTASYIVTPPTLFIPRDGMTFSLLSRSKRWVDGVIELIEDGMQGTTATVYANYSSPSDEHWIWVYQQMALSDIVLVDCATATDFDKTLAVNEGLNSTVWWIDTDELEDNMAAFLYTTGAKTADTVEEFFDYMTSGS